MTWEGYHNEMQVDKRIYQIAELMTVNLDMEVIIKHQKGDDDRYIDVFHSRSNHEEFIYFDHFKDPTDQNDMVYLAIRVLRSREPKVFPIFKELYLKNSPRCNLELDYWNQSNYRRVFNSAFYIKKQEVYQNRIVSWHGLE